MSALTICGVPVDAFREQPTADELARIIADWPALDVARFLIALGYEIDGQSQYSLVGERKRRDIAHALVVEESEVFDGHGSALIADIARIVKQSEMAEART